jgi:hypothetical protein
MANVLFISETFLKDNTLLHENIDFKYSTSCGFDVSGHPHPAQNWDYIIQRTQDTDNELNFDGCESYTFGGLHTAFFTCIGFKPKHRQR